MPGWNRTTREPAPRQVDHFDGGEALVSLSEKLMTVADEALGDDEVAAALGPACVPAFRFAAARLRGRVRKVTREPTICHSADIALRAADLGYPSHVRVVGLLHDVVEDASRGVEDAHALLEELAERFEPAIARDVHLLTNIYHLILDGVEAHVPPSLPFDRAALDRVRAAVEAHRRAVSGGCREQFARQFGRLDGFLATGWDFAADVAEARNHSGHSVYRAIRRLTYPLYVEDMADDALDRERWSTGRLYEPVLAVKFLDMVDNLRTSDVGTRVSLEKILAKAEMALDKTFYLHDHVHAAGATERSLFLPLYDLLKYTLVEQLVERQHALAFLADTRFRVLTRYLAGEVARLLDKYQLAVDRVGELVRQRESIRRLNDGAAVVS